jgi:hypothetical protein
LPTAAHDGTYQFHASTFTLLQGKWASMRGQRMIRRLHVG